MAAEVLGCGHAFHLFSTIASPKKLPFVHMHFMTDEETGKEQGYELLEMCCHACGASLLLYFPHIGSSKKPKMARDEFVGEHRGCKPFANNEFCPNFRSSFKRLDLRAKEKAAKQGPHLAQGSGHSS